jgi:uncharacterized membrane protein
MTITTFFSTTLLANIFISCVLLCGIIMISIVTIGFIYMSINSLIDVMRKRKEYKNEKI